MFGTPNTAFGTSAASTSSPFSRPATTGFGQPAFGGTPSNNLFGGGTTQSSGLFGVNTTTPAFGQTQTTQPAFGGFTAPSSGSTSLFGTQQNASTSSGLFGATTTPAFGQPKTSFGFGSTQPSGSLFGQQPQQTSLFGQPSTQSATGLFGSTPGFGATPTATGGTTIKFTPVTGTDTMVKNGASQSVSTRHHCITCMKEYEAKSLEELRLEDYAAGRKGQQQGAQTGTGLFGASTQPTLFGASTSTGGLFGATENKSLFGTTNQGFGATTGNTMFGQTNTNTGTLFGKPAGTATPFGAPATTSTPSFGFNNPSTNLFGANTQAKPFGATTAPTGGLFGATSQPSTTGFGTQSTGFGTGFGAQPTAFGQAKPPFSLGSTPNTSFSFSQPATSTATGSLFGQKPATTGFAGFGGTNTQTSTAFGASTFGQTNQNASPFGGGGLLGGGTSLFPSSTKPGGLFGQTNTTGGNLFSSFGNTSTFNTGGSTLGGLGTQPTLGGGLGTGLGTLGSLSTQNPISQHLAAYSSIPFGDSPLFKNLLAPTGKADELIKPTSPAAQKALISGQNYKISPKNSSKIKIKPVESNITKKSLFDGLDDGDRIDSDFPSPISRPNPKSLFFQPRPVGDVVPIAQSSSLSRTSNQINELSPVIKTSPKTLMTTPKIRLKESRENGTHDDSLEDTANPINDRLLVNQNPNETPVGEIRPAETSLNASSPNVNDETNNASAAISSSSDSDMEDTPPPELDGTMTEHPARIVLRRAGYYTIPSLDELARMVAPDGSCVVDNFAIGRLNYGNVYYPDSFDVAGLNLDEIVHFRHKEVVVYPDDDKKPPVGVGLNRRAQVTLDRVWPVDKSTRMPITDPMRIAAMDYESKLLRASAKHGTKFVEYRPQTGSWVFKVEHFSKYGLSDSDEEDNAPGEIKKIKIGPPDSVMINKNLPSSTPLQPMKEAVQGKKSLAARAVLLGEEDEEMDDGITTPFGLDEEMERRHLSPTSKLAKETGTSSHKLQMMKASFFDQDDYNIDGEYLGMDEMDQPPVFQVNGFGFDAKKMAQALSWYKKNTADFIDGYSDGEPDYEPRTEVDVERQMPEQDDVSIDSEVVEQYIARQIRPKAYVLRHKGFTPYSEVLGNAVNKGCISDLCAFMGRNCRIGWGPESRLTIHSTFTAASGEKAPNLFESIQGRSKDDMSPSLIQCHRLFAADESPVTFQDTVVQHLEIAYKQSVFNRDSPCPLVSPKSGISGLHRHNVAATNLAQGLNDPHLKSAATVWNLCTALWGNIGDWGPETHSAVMQRKNAVSDWLESVLADEVTDEANRLGGTASVYSFLTGHKILEACEQAHKVGDYHMPLLFNQCGSGVVVQSMIQKQLTQWRETMADAHIDKSRLKCLMLAAGLKVHALSKGVLNSCHEISWLRAFALHLWYFTSLSASVTDALVEYDKAFSGPEDENYASSPAPLYTDQFTVETLSKKPIHDVRYHLLKLFSTKSYPLEPILDPATFTPDALDYRLSWFLMRVLLELGYSHVNNYSACLVNSSFASQLEAQGLWHWALFIHLHHPEPNMREKAVKDLLERHVSLEDGIEEEDFVQSRLGVPESWIYEAKAIKAKTKKRYDDAAKYLLKAQNWDESHKVIMNHICSTAIINENYEYLECLLKELTFEDRCKDVSGWSNGGEIVLEYLGVVRQVNEVVAARDPAIGYHLERLQNQLKDLCLKIKLMKANTPLDSLSQAEMSKRTGDLIQNLVINHCSDESPSGLNVLGHLMDELPLPSDSAQQEWQAVLASWQNSLAISDEEPQS